MDVKTVKEKLQQVADYTVLPEYAEALETAVRMIDRVEELEAELKDERYRHDRYADYSVERDGMIDRLLEDLLKSIDRCKFCEQMEKPLLCVGSDYFCDECNQHTCVCRDCLNGSKWAWRGMPNRIESDTVKVEG